MDQVEQLSNDNSIFGSGFNIVLEMELDRKGGAKTTHFKLQEIIRNWIENYELVDVWRAHHPLVTQYTWCHKKPVPVYSRLDYFLVSFGLLGYIKRSEISPGYKSDHSLIKLNLKTTSNRRGQGFLKLNCSFLEHDKYIKKITTTIQETIENNPNTENPQLWDTLKCWIRGETVAYASKIKSLQDKGLPGCLFVCLLILLLVCFLLKDLQEDIINNATEIENLQPQLTNEVEDRTQNAMFCAQVKYQVESKNLQNIFLTLKEETSIGK